MSDKLKQKTILALSAGIIYLIWLYFVIDSPIGWVFAFLETAMFVLLILFTVNHWTRSYRLHGGNYSMRWMVDIFIPTLNEPPQMLEKTIKAAQNILYSNKRIYLLDDGNRTEIKALAEQLGVEYIVRPDLKEKKFKAANLNYGLKRSFGNFILTIDADNVVKPNILDDLLGHFSDEKVALVASRQRFEVDEYDFNNDNIFYEYMQTGKNADGSAISCGSGVIYRRSALREIGGFQEWNIVEDMYTSYIFNQNGYKTVYVNQSYTTGDGPTDLRTIYKQRGTWAQDTLRMIFWRSPFIVKGLNWRQRLHYFELGYIYIVSGLIVPGIYLINFYSILYNDPIIHVGIWYLIFKVPAFLLLLKVYNDLGQGQSSSRMWAALFPVYFKAAIGAIGYKKTPYKVTAKGQTAKRDLGLAWPQISLILCGIVFSIYHVIHFGITPLLIVNLFWFCVMIYWVWPVIAKAWGK